MESVESTTVDTPTDTGGAAEGGDVQALESLVGEGGGEAGGEDTGKMSKNDLGATDEAPEPPKPERKKFTFKVDGKEIAEELSEHEIQTRLQKALAVEKRFQDVANQRKQIEAALAQIKENPAKALKELAGLDLDEWAEKRLIERYNDSLMSDEEREKITLQKKLAAYEKQEAEQKTAQERAKQEAYEKQIFEQTERDFMAALDKLGYDKGFSKTTLLPMLADVAETALEYGVDLTPDQMAAEVNRRLEQVHRRQVGSLRGESLLKYLGDEAVNEIIKAKLAATKIRPNAAAPIPAPAREPKPPTSKPMTPAEFRNKHLFDVL